MDDHALHFQRPLYYYRPGYSCIYAETELAPTLAAGSASAAGADDAGDAGLNSARVKRR